MSSRPAWEWPWPDPALGPRRPGLRPHRHPPNRLPIWCLEQADVWCDYYGNEHLISHMPLDYVENVIVYLRRRAKLLFGPRLADLYLEAIELTLLGLEGSDALLERAKSIEALGPEGSLEATPLIVALRQRLERRNGNTPKRSRW